MPQKLKTYFNWSSGKDASLALYYLQREKKYHVDRLLTSINTHHDRVSMHGLRRELLEKQIKSIGLPLTTIELPEKPTMEDYNHIMNGTIIALKSKGYTNCGFGDIFLEDLRTYREEQLIPHGIACHFPLWKRDTKEIISEFIELGFKAIVICVKSELLDATFVGREIDENFIHDLPPKVDPCGENGEFHTFCYDGPIFTNPIKFDIGEKVYREYKTPKRDSQQQGKDTLGFWFCDLISNEK
ncbi:MAG: adenine nucleotide alpha hydrolase [Maribacter sp.]|nr:adenine nucleotide alpha hydrolase [Maribacter sp.]